MYNSLYIKIFLLPLLLLVSGCAGFLPNPYEITNPQAPYIVNGIKYYPLATAEGFDETGIASWYGPNFHGKRTANGEIYNQHLYTAAHKTLPLNCYVYVENLENGKIIEVKINDRGPFAEGRIIDLSRKGALELGMLEKGTARVRVYESKGLLSGFLENLSDDDNSPQTNKNSATQTGENTVVSTPLPVIETTVINDEYDSDQTYQPPSSSGASTYLTLGSFSSRSEANKAIETLNDLGLSGRIIPTMSGYLIDSGPYPTRKDAQNKIAVLKSRFPKVKIK